MVIYMVRRKIDIKNIEISTFFLKLILTCTHGVSVTVNVFELKILLFYHKFLSSSANEWQQAQASSKKVYIPRMITFCC